MWGFFAFQFARLNGNGFYAKIQVEIKRIKFNLFRADDNKKLCLRVLRKFSLIGVIKMWNQTLNISQWVDLKRRMSTL